MGNQTDQITRAGSGSVADAPPTGSTASGIEVAPAFIGYVEVPVRRFNGNAETVRHLSIGDDVFALRPNGCDEDTADPLFTITHRPTGHALMQPVVWDFALTVMDELRQRGYDRWRFTDPSYARQLKAERDDIIATAKRRIGGAWLDR